MPRFNYRFRRRATSHFNSVSVILSRISLRFSEIYSSGYFKNRKSSNLNASPRSNGSNLGRLRLHGSPGRSGFSSMPSSDGIGSRLDEKLSRSTCVWLTSIDTDSAVNWEGFRTRFSFESAGLGFCESVPISLNTRMKYLSLNFPNTVHDPSSILRE